MQKAEKTNEISVSAEQKLPVQPAKAPAAAVLSQPVHSDGVKLQTTKSDAVGESHAATPGGPALASSASSATGPAPQSLHSASPSMPAPAPIHSLERTHELMALHAVQLRDSGGATLQVMIKPSPDLQLLLNLRSHDGHVDMQATLHHGDFNLLNQHWPQLQQQLEQRGIRLASLTSGAPTGNEGHSHFQQPDRRPSDEDGAATGAFAEFALNGALKPAAKTKTRTLRGWESWA